MKEKRGPWYLFTGLAFGLVVGVLYSWLAAPVQFLDTNPAALHPDFRAEYRALIALAYMADGDLGRAQARLMLLQDEDPSAALKAQASRAVQAQRPEREVQALDALAARVARAGELQTALLTPAEETLLTPPPGAETPQDLEVTPTPRQDQMILTPTATPLAAATARPTFTPRAVLKASFALSGRQEVCDRELPQGLLQIEILDSAGKPVAGVRTVMAWAGGENAFYTGLNPRISPGYADFQMAPGVVYSLKVGESGETITGLTPHQCTPEGTQTGEGAAPTPESAFWGGVRLRFAQK
ncbi:MAG: hypothetical protein IT308_09795 [Anaerolineaceae bacterium]|nr:hypothetical protein [Anaerolineaceae bacterium]